MTNSSRACISVLAGTNGAGKSSVAGKRFTERGGTYFNPDEETRRILGQGLGISLEEVNSVAWEQGRRLLERAINLRLDYNFETTLGGSTITRMLEEAALNGIEVRIWYVGLASPELHLARVRSRVSVGGHDIPEEKIRERYDQSRANLIRLLPKLTELLLYDNSADADPKTGKMPRPKLLLHCKAGRAVKIVSAVRAPQWAKPILAAALKNATSLVAP